MCAEAHWSLDYCLSCDKQTSEGVYCSQSCRLLDLASAGTYSTPSTRPSSFCSSSSWSSPMLPTAFDFSAYKPSSKGLCMSPGPDSDFDLDMRKSKAPSVTSMHQLNTLPYRAGSTCSSRSSISSTNTSSISNTLRRESRQELQKYEGFFTKTRRQPRHPPYS